MTSFFESYRLEIGIILALVTIGIIGKLFLKSKKSRQVKEDTKDNNNNYEEKATENKNNLIIQSVATVSELQNGEMKEVDIADGKVLLVKTNDEFYAIGAKCTHYGAPLKNGALGNGRIRCPWHGACFNLKTGDIEDYPCVDALHIFKTRVEGQNVIVTVPTEALKNNKRTPKMCSQSKSDQRVFAIVGGGPGGLICAETLRQEGFQGKIILITKEKHLPYDRPKLSKALNSNIDQILLRKKEFFDNHDIIVLLETEVSLIDSDAQTLTFKNGATLRYDAACLATGGDPRSLPVDGMNLGNIFQLRVPEDAQNIVASVDKTKKVIIVGTSFIGMEAASCIADKAASIIAIGMEKVPFERVLGAKIGAALQKLHESKGIQFRLEKIVKEFKGKNGKVSSVILNDNEELEADVCIIGAGIIPATKYVKPNTLKMFKDGGIIVDKYMQAEKNVYAIGDIAKYPYFISDNLIRVEHYGMAQYQGKIAALNMLGKKIPIENIPFFWTTQYGKSLRYTGYAFDYDEVFIDGDLDNLKFVAYFIKQNDVLAVAAFQRDPAASTAAELMINRKMPKADKIKSGEFKL